MLLSHLVKTEKQNIKTFNFDQITPIEVQQDHSLNTRWYLVLKNDEIVNLDWFFNNEEPSPLLTYKVTSIDNEPLEDIKASYIKDVIEVEQDKDRFITLSEEQLLLITRGYHVCVYVKESETCYVILNTKKLDSGEGYGYIKPNVPYTLDLDLSLLFLETNLNKCTSWEELGSLLTTKLIEAYLVTIPKNDSNNLLCTHLFNTDDFELSYCNMNTPENRNISTFKWRMPDLAITKTNNKNTTNLLNCICIVNGLITKPHIRTNKDGSLYEPNELLMKNGAKFMSSTTKLHQPSAVLLDFSELGDIEFVSFSECEIEYQNKNNTKSYISDIKLTIPDKYSLQNKTIFPVIANSLFFPDDAKITSSRSIIISPYKLPIRKLLLKLYQHTENFLKNTDIIKTDYSVVSYIEDEMFKDSYGNFFIIVNNPQIFIEKTHAVCYSDSTYSTLATDGILFDKATQSIYDYVKVEYASITDLYTNRRNNNYEFDLPFNDYCYGVEEWDCVHKERLFNIHNSDIYLLNIFGK